MNVVELGNGRVERTMRERDVVFGLEIENGYFKIHIWTQPNTGL